MATTLSRTDVAGILPKQFDDVKAPAFVSETVKGLFLVPEGGKMLACPDPRRLSPYSAKAADGTLVRKAPVWPENKTEKVMVANVEHYGSYQAGLAGAVVICNRVPRPILRQAFRMLHASGKWRFWRSQPYSAADLNRVLAWLATQFWVNHDGKKVFCNDQYITDKGYIDGGTAVMLADPKVPDFGPTFGTYTGIAMRSAEDATRFARVAKDGTEADFIALLHGPRADKTQQPRDITRDILKETYRHLDGRAITDTDIANLPVITLS